MNAKNPVLCVLILLLASAAAAERPLTLRTVVNQEIPERWQFSFDSRQWKVGHRDATSEQAIREYVLQGETVDSWSEMVTSLFSARTDVEIRDLFKNMKRLLSQDCPTFHVSIIEQEASSILYEWWHEGCRGLPAQHEITKIAKGPDGIGSLHYAAKTVDLSEERRAFWISIIRNATLAAP